MLAVREEDVAVIKLAIQGQHLQRAKAALAPSAIRQHANPRRLQCFKHADIGRDKHLAPQTGNPNGEVARRRMAG